MYTLPLHAATSVVANNALPQGGQFFDGNKFAQGTEIENGLNFAGIGSITKPNDLTMNSATVNFTSDKSNFNTLNYINSGAASQIYGTINGLGGNIYVVNTAGVQIGPSAQINVGSLHVSNKNLDNVDWEAINNVNPDINSIMGQGTTGDAALMSLGNINATNVTFEGDGRIVIDSERIKNENVKLTSDKIFINTNDKNNVVIGYEAYENGSYTGVAKTEELATLNGSDKLTKADGYMWVEDVEQLQAIGENAETLTGNYALRNSIDGTEANDFKAIGSDTAFKGNFDGIDYNIFNLNINGTENVGLFGQTVGATISNVTMVGGNITGTGSNVGAVVGNAQNTTLTNVVNSAAVTGVSNVGGIVGSADNTLVQDAVNTGTIKGTGTNVGGLIGKLQNSKFVEATGDSEEIRKGLLGNSYNLGDVSGDGYNVGGLVGHAVNSTIGDGTNLVYNRLDVKGAYNVGGIVGNMEGTTVQNAENSGNVTASGYTTEDYIYHSGEDDGNKVYTDGTFTPLGDNKYSVSVSTNVANVGGIAGKADDTVNKVSKIENVTNTGNVSSNKQENNNYYDAGNVGGIVGSAVDTNITNATNRENEVRGAHNVGGVAGYFGNSDDAETAKHYTVTNGINDGGDIMATGARYNNKFMTEVIRPIGGSKEIFTIGNIGGVVGYMDGDNVYVTGSANRGTVHTDEPTNPANVEEWQKAANVGGVVGKIDRSDTLELSDLNGNVANAAVSNSYNTGDVLGYTGVGGVVGMMYNGEVAQSYNLGYIRSTRQSQIGGQGSIIDALNMGGIVGDTTENSQAKVLLYDVYNKGQIGDEEFKYFGRHIGGIVGRLSGTVEKAYNTGAIYNGYNVVGGIAGWVFEGSINNAFNTGNITVYNQNNHSSQVGGIVGAAQGGHEIIINNVYNLGTLRSFDVGYGFNSVGGILGTATQSGTVNINNAYTTGNLYSGKLDTETNIFKEDLDIVNITNNRGEVTGKGFKVNSIYGSSEYNASVVVGQNTYYIQPDNDKNGKPLFTKLTDEHNSANHTVEFSNKSDYDYNFDGGITKPNIKNGNVDEDSAWRIYDGNTPILNAFLPNAEDYFDDKTLSDEGIGSIQYGTAYDPLLTIIKANRHSSLWCRLNT